MSDYRTRNQLLHAVGRAIPVVACLTSLSAAGQCAEGPSEPPPGDSYHTYSPEDVFILNGSTGNWESTPPGMSGTISSPKTFSFTRDPRPAIWFRLWNSGSTPSGGWPSDNPTRLAWNDTADSDSNGVADGVDSVRDKLDFLYDLGWRRIHLRLPGGIMANETIGTPTWSDGLFPMQQWWHLDATLRDDFEVMIDDWLTDNSDATLGVYIGRAVNVAWNPCKTNGEVDLDPDCYDCTDTANWIDADDSNGTFDWGWLGGSAASDPTDRDYMENLFLNVQPWFDMGFEEVYFDNFASTSASPTSAWDQFQTLLTSPDWYDRRMGAEAIPGDSGAGGTPYLDGDLTETPLLCTNKFLSLSGAYINDTSPPTGRAINVVHPNPDEPGGGWTGDPETEILVIIDKFGTSTELDPQTWFAADYHALAVGDYVLGQQVAGLGLSLDSSQSTIYKRISGIYDFPLSGLDACQEADVNIDGSVTTADYCELLDLITGATTREALPGPWASSGDFNDGLGIYHGDINDDGAVTAADLNAWITANNNCTSSTAGTTCP